MKLARKYILGQVAEGKLEKERAAEILAEMNGLSREVEHDIAIIGMAARFPKAKDIDEFWDVIRNKVNCIDIPTVTRREVMNAIYENLFNVKDIGEDRYEAGGYLDEVDKFDAEFFGISLKEALLMNPLQKVMLEAVYLAVENAGMTRERIANTDTGVFIGRDNACITLYNEYVGNIHPLALTGAYAALLSSRISHVLKVTGPSMVIDTACSSAMVCVHHACKALRAGECGMAIAGGINIKDILVRNDDNPMDKIISDDVKIKTFDKDAKGTLLSEGVGAVLLKPLKKAIEDGDCIHAVIKGSAVNNDGGANRIATPRAETQSEVLVEAWKDAGIHPETLSYIEAHGIGTYLGDPIEIRAIKHAYEQYTDKKQFCAISAVKTNIGHTVAASGMASLIKAVLSLKNRKIPPLINFEESNPHINFPDSPVFVNDTLREWEAGDTPRRCGVNSFGFGGTNCHIVLEERPETRKNGDVAATGKMLFALSARTKEALKQQVERYNSFLGDCKSSLSDLCYTAGAGRGHYEHRMIMTVESLKDLREKIGYLRSMGQEYMSMEGICYGEHRICKSYKEDKKEGDVTQKEVDQLTEEADQILQDMTGGVIPDAILQGISQLYVAGADIDWKTFYRYTGTHMTSLPGYPLERKSCWFREEDYGLFRVKKRNRAVSYRSGNEPVESAVPENITDVKPIGRNAGTYSKTEQHLVRIWGRELGLKEVHVDENYFELGGDSISGIRIVNTINRELSIRITLAELLKYPTISELAGHLDTKPKTPDEELTIRAVEKREFYPLSSAQMRVFIHNQIVGGTAYNLPRVLIMEGPVDIERIKTSLHAVIQRHETLRTSFHLVRGEYVQKVHDDVEFQLEYEESKGNSFNEEYLYNFVQIFDLTKAPLFRAKIIVFSATRYALMLDMHHIIADRASMIILMNEFADLYGGKQLPDLQIQYKDYAVWQMGNFESGALKKQEDYWLDVYADKIPSTAIKTDYNKEIVNSFEEKLEVYKLDKDFETKVVKFSSSTGLTLNMVLFAVYNVLLWKWTGSEDIVVGISIMGRNYRELENVVGMFVNTLAIRSYPNGNKTFLEFLAETKTSLMNAYANQDYPYETLVDNLRSKFSSNIDTLFNTMFIMQNMNYPDLEIKDLKAKPYYIPVDARFDLQFDIFETDDEILNLCFMYPNGLYKEETIQNLLSAYLDILSQGVADPDKKLRDFQVGFHN